MSTVKTDARARRRVARRKWMRFPIKPREGYKEYEPVRVKSLDFEDRSNVDWSGYYQDGEVPKDYE